MSFSLVVVLVFVACQAISGQVPCNQNCPVNETYTDCSAGQFQETCWKKSQSIDFSSGCASGCVCHPGFTRDPNTFLCVLRRDCPVQRFQVCPKNEEYGVCGYGCDKTCGFANRDLICRSCFPGCICKRGFVRSLITGQCILVASCKGLRNSYSNLSLSDDFCVAVCPAGYSLNPSTQQCSLKCEQCPALEFFNRCGSICSKTCDNPTGEGIFCSSACNPQCDCIQGYLRSDRTRRCVLASNCPSGELLTIFSVVFYVKASNRSQGKMSTQSNLQGMWNQL